MSKHMHFWRISFLNFPRNFQRGYFRMWCYMAHVYVSYILYLYSCFLILLVRQIVKISELIFFSYKMCYGIASFCVSETFSNNISGSSIFCHFILIPLKCHTVSIVYWNVCVVNILYIDILNVN